MANRADAEAGWQLFVESNFTLAHKEINAELKRSGYAPVSERMFRHYRKLRMYGYDFYIPINQLDVKTLSDPVWDRAIRSRYLTRHVDEPMILYSPTDKSRWKAQAVLISDGVLVAKADVEDPAKLLKLARAHTSFDVTFVRSGEIRRASLENVSVRATESGVTLRFLFEDFASSNRLALTEPLPLGRLQLTIVQVSPEPLLGAIAQQMYWLFQALETARVACDEVLAEIDSTQSRNMQAPSVHQLSLRSPLEILLEGSNPYIVGVVLLLGRLNSYRKTFYEGSEAKQSARSLRWEQDQREAVASADSSDIAQQVIQMLKREIGLEVEDGPDLSAQKGLTEALETEVAPPLMRLLDSTEEIELPDHDPSRAEGEK